MTLVETVHSLTNYSAKDTKSSTQPCLEHSLFKVKYKVTADGTMIIDDITVLPRNRKTGIAHRVIFAIAVHCKRQGLTLVTPDVDVSLYHFWRRVGFTPKAPGGLDFEYDMSQIPA